MRDLTEEEILDGGLFEWLKYRSKCATPVKQPKPDSSPIDWEERRWELATKIYVNGNLWERKQAIEFADSFIHEYKNTPIP